MVSLRHFEESDAEVLQTYKLSGKGKDDIISMIHDWNMLSYKGHYFEMFAIQNDATVVGSISIYERSKSIVSLGIEIFAPYRQMGHAYEAMRLLIEFAAQKGFKIILQQVRNDNNASIRLHEKLGFETDGHVYENQKGHKVLIYLMPLNS
jgi:RimJ/RimL family protein N-acetyltransferase